MLSLSGEDCIINNNKSMQLVILQITENYRRNNCSFKYIETRKFDFSKDWFYLRYPGYTFESTFVL